MDKIFGPNWLTTVGGILSGVPTLVLGSGFVLSPNGQHALQLIGGVGLLLLGVAAKSATTHSTVAQVEASTVKALQVPPSAK